MLVRLSNWHRFDSTFEFVKQYPELKHHKYTKCLNYKKEILRFYNVVNDLKCIYQKKHREMNDNYAIKKFYEGYIKSIEKLQDSYSYKPSGTFGGNDFYDYDKMRMRLSNENISLLERADYEFCNISFSRGAFFMGCYFANRELSAICNHFNILVNEERRK